MKILRKCASALSFSAVAAIKVESPEDVGVDGIDVQRDPERMRK